jgi:hypothetical protein
MGVVRVTRSASEDSVSGRTTGNNRDDAAKGKQKARAKAVHTGHHCRRPLQLHDDLLGAHTRSGALDLKRNHGANGADDERFDLRDVSRLMTQDDTAKRQQLEDR